VKERVAARPRETGDKPVGDWIVDNEDDRDGRRRALGRESAERTATRPDDFSV